MNLYGFANGDPVNFSDPFGLCPICIAAVVGVIEAGSAIYDIYQTYKAFKRSPSEGAEALQFAVVGALAPGPGTPYRRIGSQVVDVVSDPSLWKKLAFEELMGDARSGIGGVVIAGAGHGRRQIDEVGRLVREYGGNAADWRKMAGQTRRGPGGIQQQVHWYENIRTHERVEFKPTNPY